MRAGDERIFLEGSTKFFFENLGGGMRIFFFNFLAGYKILISTFGGGGVRKFFPSFSRIKPKKVIFFSEQIFQKMWGVEKDFSKFWGYNNWGVESKFQNSKKCSHPLTPWNAVGMQFHKNDDFC